MSGGRAKSPKLELRLNLSPPRADDGHYHLQTKESPNSSPSSCESSCISSSPTGLEANRNSNGNVSIGYLGKDPRPRMVASMVVVGCPRCLMYVMLSEVDPKCPRCKSSVLLDFVNEDNHSAKKNRI
ncbi:hypothetical protein ACJRO7_003492 [Eucalyptus globulus]|uniref:GIR1-like zinc ribbon domain-containing protein n=1 Tax=Eucalyptus globulus TaxID=34317 RepID=A0ABD3IUQ4_EUCGL